MTNQIATPPDRAETSVAPAVHTIAATTHGRYLVAPAEGAGPAPLLAGFHGYGEHAERHLADLDRIPGSARWTRVAVQALHRHYSEGARHVVGSWMTRQDRELAIAGQRRLRAGGHRRGPDGVCDHRRPCLLRLLPGSRHGLSRRRPLRPRLPRGHRPRRRPPARAAHGPDPRLAPGSDRPGAGPTRGTRRRRWDTDLAALRGAGAVVEPLVFDGGHAWTDDFRAAAGRFLATLA